MSNRPAPLVASTIVESDTSIPIAGGASMTARIYGSRRRGEVAPLVLHFHGGAFVSGDLESGACMARLLAEVDAVVVSVAYPLAPEHRFPDAVEAGYAALEWLYKQRNKLGGKDARVYLAGDEAGGNLAAAVALVARDRGHPPLAGQILVAPMLDPCVGTASLRETQICDTGCKWAEGWQQYLRGPMDAEHPYAVPGKARRLVDLPPALILTGQDDPMRDEALAYAQRLRDAGIAVTSGLLGDPTGWPDSLAASPEEECPCALGVKQHLRAFFKAAPLTGPS
jgi:acetyl esterase/lipase